MTGIRLVIMLVILAVVAGAFLSCGKKGDTEGQQQASAPGAGAMKPGGPQAGGPGGPGAGGMPGGPRGGPGGMPGGPQAGGPGAPGGMPGGPQAGGPGGMPGAPGAGGMPGGPGAGGPAAGPGAGGPPGTGARAGAAPGGPGGPGGPSGAAPGGAPSAPGAAAEAPAGGEEPEAPPAQAGPKLTKQQVKAKVAEALAAKRKGDLDTALQLIREAISAAPQDVEANWVAAWILAQMNDPALAVGQFQRVMKLGLDSKRMSEAQAAIKRLKARAG